MTAGKYICCLLLLSAVSSLSAQNPCWPPIVGTPQESTDQAIRSAIERLRSLKSSPGLTAMEKEQLLQGLKRLDQGMKFKTPKGHPAPRVVDGTLAFIRRRKANERNAPAATSPDTRTQYTFGWGSLQYILVNFSVFNDLCKQIKLDCPLTSSSARDEFLNSLLAVSLAHEAIHVDQTGPARQKPGPGNRECSAILFELALMQQIQWSDPCLAGKWADQVGSLLDYYTENGCL